MADVNKPKGKSTVRQQGRPVSTSHISTAKSSGTSSANKTTGGNPGSHVSRPTTGSNPKPAANPVRFSHEGPGRPGGSGGPGGPGRPGGPGFHGGPGAPPRPPRSHRSPRPRRKQSIGSTILAVLLLLLILGAAIWFQNRGNSGNPTDSSFRWHTPSPVAQIEVSETDSDNPNILAQDTFLSEDATLEVHVLDVGQGLSVFLTCGDETLLYDGGGRSTSSFVVSYLQKQGIDRLDYVVVSHYDADHLAGVIGALNVFEIDTLIAPNYQTDTKLFSSFQRTVQAKELSITSPVPGTAYSFGTGEFQILAPIDSSYENENDYSIVLRVCLGENTLLLTGDASENSESEMMEQGVALQSDVLVVGHHGSAGSTSAEFLEAIKPSYAIISCGRDNDYGHPSKRVMALLEEMEIPVYRTDLQETVIFRLTGQEVLFEKDPCEDYSSGKELYGQSNSNDSSYDFQSHVFSSICAKIPGAILLRVPPCQLCMR